MPALQKARLMKITSPKSGDPEVLEQVDVQFNPTSLKLQITNKSEGGRSAGRSKRQNTGQSSATLTMDLHYDTADEGTTDEPVSVRERTRFVESFVRPGPKGSEPPPKVRFHWGNLVFDGLVETVDVDFDHFAASGVPLRAKVGLAIVEQDPTYEIEKPKADEAGGGKKPDAGSATDAAPGGAAGGVFDRVAMALAGETAVDISARLGLDPSAWRGLSVDLGASLELGAGVEVGFSASLGASVGLGATVGFAAGVDVSLEAAFGLDADTSASGGAPAASGGAVDSARASGFALASAGGVQSAIESVAIARTSAAAAAARGAFTSKSMTPLAPGAPLASGASGAPSASPPASRVAPARPGRPEQDRAPLAVTSGTGSIAGASRTSPPAPPPPRVDRRAATYGYGVPLRPRVSIAADERNGVVVVGSSRSAAGDRAGAPSWTRLPSPSAAPGGTKHCACRGPCGHRGGTT